VTEDGNRENIRKALVRTIVVVSGEEAKEAHRRAKVSCASPRRSNFLTIQGGYPRPGASRILKSAEAWMTYPRPSECAHQCFKICSFRSLRRTQM
jgi:hypothetical protein